MSENCINKLIEVTGLSKEDAIDVATRTEKLLKEGKSAEDIMNDMIEFKEKRAEYVNAMNRYNVLRDRAITTNLKQRVMNQLDNPKEIIRWGSLEINNPIKTAILGIVRQHFHHRGQLYDTFTQSIDRYLRDNDLVEYATDAANSKNIYQEMAALKKDQARTSSVTGDDKAFKVAQKQVELSNQMLARKSAAGSTVWYRDDYIFSQKWEGDKVSKLSDDEFFALMRDKKWNKADVAALDAAEKVKAKYLASKPKPKKKIKVNREQISDEIIRFKRLGYGDKVFEKPKSEIIKDSLDNLSGAIKEYNFRLQKNKGGTSDPAGNPIFLQEARSVLLDRIANSEKWGIPVDPEIKQLVMDLKPTRSFKEYNVGTWKPKKYVSKQTLAEKKVEALELQKMNKLMNEAAEAARKAEWIKFKREVESGNYIDPDEILEGGGDLGSGSLAELSGRSRSIELTPEQYIEIEDKVFAGSSFLERSFLEAQSNARVIADLEMFGSKPEQNFDKVINSLIAEKKNVINTELEPFFIRGKKGVLENNFYQSSSKDKSILVKTMFGQKASDQELAAWSNTIRGLDAMSRLMGATVTAFSDLTVRAVNDTLISGNQRQVFETFADSTNTLIKSFGKDGLGIVEDTWVGMSTVFDEITSHIRLEDVIELSKVDRTASVRSGLDWVASTGFKLNGLKIWTDANRKGSFAMSMSSYARLADKTLDEVTPYAREQLRAYGITDSEWDFIRSKALTKTARGDNILSPTQLNKLALDEYKRFNATDNAEVLKTTRNEIVAKWSNFLRGVTDTKTMMPDVVDKATLLRGTQAGTLPGEAMRFATMYKSFAFGYARRVFLSQLKYGNAMTHFQYAMTAAAMGMLVFTLKDLAKGRTPRDFTNPQNAVGLFFHVYGFPYVDQLAFTLNSDNVQASNIYDMFAGPIGGDGVDFIQRTINLAKDDDPDYAKYAMRTFAPMVPFRNHPLTTGIYNQGYNYIMRGIDPKFERKHQKLLESMGQQEIKFGS